ncbi:MAG: TonB-dependent receptor [Holophagales bacterium]|nr:TonB-dependent receptor [Holophagales bacterium]MBK9967322.1 TonB-dependent receptor [Holophagales bacterium]
MQTTPPSRAGRALIAPLAGLLLLAACGRKAPEAPKDPAGPAGLLGTASVAGRVTFAGTLPPNEKVTMATDPFCAGHNPGETEIPACAVGPDGALANVLVRVTAGVSGSYSPPAEARQLDQKGCAYSPRVLALMTGQPLDIVSSDDTLHNVHAAAKENKAFNLGMPAAGTRYTRTFAKPEIVPFKCDVHPWMRAWVAVVPHPFFSVTGPDGLFEIKGLPAGTYTIEAWHEKLDAQPFTVTVADGEKSVHDVRFTDSSSAASSSPAAAPTR